MAVAANYDDVLAQMQDAGLVFAARDLPLEVGRLRRVAVEDDRERRGWYCLHELPVDSGEVLLVGSFGVWHGMDNGARRVELRRRQLTVDENAALKARLADDRRQATLARKRTAAAAARRAESVWLKCEAQPPGDTPPGYLQRKGVQPHGVRFTETGAIVVPMMDGAGKVHGLQFILDREAHRTRIAKTGRDKEYWPAGLVKEGHFHLIGSPDAAGIVLVAEGYATAASLHQATQLPVAVAFDAGNLQRVGQAMRQRYKRARVLFCADDDAYGKCPSCKRLTPQPAEACIHCGADTGRLRNAGVTAAELAAVGVPNSAWLPPTFTDFDGRHAAATERGVKRTDFNDLHQAEGLAAVTLQIEGKLRALGWQSQSVAAPTRTPGEVGAGGGAASLPSVWTIDGLLADYALIYGTETVFDRPRFRIIGLSSLRAAAGKGLVRMWLEHPLRVTVLPEEVGFDPTGADENLRCNLWGGWPTSPQQGACELILEMLEFLTAGETNSRDTYDWILKWLAYPIQHPGAKMQTALLVHGPEGTGKNTFFGVVRRIYGRYGGVFGQTELESQFNGWSSGRLFMVGNEVVARAELYHQQGRLKTMITEDEWQINEKNLPARLEANHCNFVLFSNRLDIAKLDPEDRRYCVVWTPPALDASFYTEVAAEIANGGVEALHHHLLHLDLGEFGPHTKPPLTRAKRDLIEYGMDSTERFWRAWTAGEIDVPCCPCATRDLYRAYQRWAREEGVPKMAQANTLIGVLAKKVGVRHGPMHHYKSTHYRLAERTKTRLLLPPEHLIPSGLRYDGVRSQMEWLTDCHLEFRNALDLGNNQ